MSAGTTDASLAELFRIYGKHRSQRQFRPMDLGAGKRVVNLIYASLLTTEQMTRFMEREAPRNPEWTFRARKVSTDSGEQ